MPPTQAFVRPLLYDVAIAASNHYPEKREDTSEVISRPGDPMQ